MKRKRYQRDIKTIRSEIQLKMQCKKEKMTKRQTTEHTTFLRKDENNH